MEIKSKDYDLRDLKERQRLIDYALDITPSSLLSIHSKMFKTGHRGKVLDMDKKMYYWLGENHYDDLIRSNITYSCLEAEFLRIDYHTPQFILLCETNKQIMWEQTKHLLPEIVAGHTINRINPPTETEMRAKIWKKWKYQPKLLILENLVETSKGHPNG